MIISLSPETQRRIQQRLDAGSFQSADDVVRAALEALDQIESGNLDEATQEAIDRSEEQIERGEYFEWKDVRENVRAKFQGQ